MADIVAGHGREDAYLELPGRLFEPCREVGVPGLDPDDPATEEHPNAGACLPDAAGKASDTTKEAR
jgi:hypothetical protein